MKDILKKIKPSKYEIEYVSDFCNKLLKCAEEIAEPFYAYPVIVGSIAKQTWLKNDHDIDLFIIFRTKISKEKLEEYGLLIGTEICTKLGGTYHFKYAEHPYVFCEIENFNVDIVPCYEIKKGEKIISAVDRSPLHTKYVIETLKPVQRDHVRLLKYFCKQIGVYGADAKNNGFSGYLCELLIICYGTFLNTLKNLSKFRFGEFIDIENIGDRKRFKDSALVVVDPVDRYRNVAFTLSAQNLLKFKVESKKYLNSKQFPKIKKLYRKDLIQKLENKRGTNFVGIKYKSMEEVVENIYLKMRKLERKVVRYIEEQGFKIIRPFSWTDEKNVIILLEIERDKITNFRKHRGPVIFSRESEHFINRYLQNEYSIYIEDNILYSDVKRKIVRCKDALKKFFKTEKIPKKIKNIKILGDEEIRSIVNEDKELNNYLTKKYFEL